MRNVRISNLGDSAATRPNVIAWGNLACRCARLCKHRVETKPLPLPRPVSLPIIFL